MIKTIRNFANNVFLAGAVHNTPLWYKNYKNEDCCKFTLVTKVFTTKTDALGPVTTERCEYHNIFLTATVAQKAKLHNIHKGSFVNLTGMIHYNTYYDRTKRADASETQIYCRDTATFNILEHTNA